VQGHSAVMQLLVHGQQQGRFTGGERAAGQFAGLADHRRPGLQPGLSEHNGQQTASPLRLSRADGSRCTTDGATRLGPARDGVITEASSHSRTGPPRGTGVFELTKRTASGTERTKTPTLRGNRTPTVTVATGLFPKSFGGRLNSLPHWHQGQCVVTLSRISVRAVPYWRRNRSASASVCTQAGLPSAHRVTATSRLSA